MLYCLVRPVLAEALGLYLVRPVRAAAKLSLSLPGQSEQRACVLLQALGPS